MSLRDGLKHSGVRAAFMAALLCGAGTPLAKLLLHAVSPWLLAGLLNLGSGPLWRTESGSVSHGCRRCDWKLDGARRVGRTERERGK